MRAEDEDPWLTIPLADYEAHMEAVGRSAALRRAFAEVYESVKPVRLAVLGCTSGTDFATIDPTVTEDAIGVDTNPEYLKAAEARTAGLRTRVRFVCGDVLAVTLPAASFDLVHAALLVEYVDLRALFRRIRGWLRPSGRLSIVSQQPSAGVPAVTRSAYTSLQRLASRMSLRAEEELTAEAGRAGFVVDWMRALELPDGKRLIHSVFTSRAPSSSVRP